MNITEKAALLKADSVLLGASDISLRNAALASIAKAIEAGREAIFEANKKDLEIAKENNVVDEITSNLGEISKMMEEHTDIETFFTSPIVKKEDKKEIVDKSLKVLNSVKTN